MQADTVVLDKSRLLQCPITSIDLLYVSYVGHPTLKT